MVPAPSRPNYLIPLILFILAVTGGWLWWRLAVPPAAGPLRLVPTLYSALPGWGASDPAAALTAFRRSCEQIAKTPDGAAMGGAGYAGTAGDWRGACQAVPDGPAGAAATRAWFETWFQPVAIGAGAVREGLFTGYYEPQLKAARQRRGPYQTPVYGVPDDLITVDLGQFREAWKHERIAGRLAGHGLVPFPGRAEIDQAGLANAPVLFYAEDPIAVFFLHIQGSGRAVFEDGTVARVAYAAQNGRPYTAIGRTLIAEGAIPREAVSLQSIRAWLKTHPADARRVMETNESYVFFKQLPLGDPALGSAGAEGVALTPEASLAVDLRLHPLGAPFFVAANVPDPDAAKPDHGFARLLIAQDTGGAIRGAVRGDVFWGFGADAQAIAGRMKAQGALFVLLPKPVAARLGAEKEFPGATP